MLGALSQQIIVMAAIMVLGFVLRRMHIINRAGTTQLSNLVLYVANPVLIAQSLMMPFEAEKLVDAAWCAAVTAAAMLACIALTHVVFGRNRGVARFAVVFSNCGFIGIPLVQSVLGAEYVFYLSICNTVSTFLLWTYGIYLISQDRVAVSLNKVVFNPCIIALVIGLGCFMLSYEPSLLVDAILSPVADLNTGLVMIVLGSYLAGADLRGIVASKLIYLVCALRLLVAPAILIALLMLAPLSTTTVKLAVLVTLATPAASTTAMFAEKFGRDYRLGSGIVAMSTLLSLVTMPLCIAVASAIL